MVVLTGIAVLMLVVITIIGGERENSLLIGVTVEFVADIPEINTVVSVKVANTVF